VRLSALSISRVGDRAREGDQEKLTALRQQQAELTTTYTTRHPSVIALQSEIDRLVASLRNEGQRPADPARRNDREKLNQLLRELAELNSIYTKGHPDVAILQFEIDRLQAGVKAEKGIIQLRGNVEIKTGMFTLVAEEADYHEDTGEIEARGNVRVKPN
jgi:uncharacterized protein involved in exopolysaccharide biosynthesis